MLDETILNEAFRDDNVECCSTTSRSVSEAFQDGSWQGLQVRQCRGDLQEQHACLRVL